MTILDEDNLLRQFGMTAARIQAFANRYFFEPVGLTISCAMILHLLEHLGPITSSEILKHTGGTKSNISQRLKFLEDLNYITREENNSDDKRLVTIRLTDEGRVRYQSLQKTLTEHAKKLESELQFTDEDKAACQRVISKINQFIDAHHEDLCQRLCQLKESK
ncbi:MAG: MarR family transcriptional regulator [Patescibacteria group bacterium]|jgi:DNA-binding MarR family transcriptional regulator